MDGLAEKALKVLDSFRLDGKVALVTGGGKGLGKAIAFALAGAGANIAVAGKTLKNVQQTAQEIEENMAKRAIAIEADVRNPGDVKEMISKVLQVFGKLDILVNNAGVADVKPITEFPLEKWEYIMDVNAKGVFLCAQEAAKVMLKQGKGKIINISSLQGFVGRAGDPAYAASKAAVNLMTKSMASEWSKNGICVNAIAPTWCWTDLTKPILSDENFYKSLRKRIPIGRAGNLEDLFGIVVFLASEASDFVSGAIIPVDGGAIACDGFPEVPV
ncbi:SDR family NAD(P)-dependent oxidoreductase [Atrimonas thermophila]|uniref:SDR family NAD(P)-dependent oxidoreductase n=1 Tax=Atrimonas thermophila TaxID=3064161 RepID=UPI00399C97C2